MSTKESKKIVRTLTGEVIKVSGKNTVKVRVEKKFPHPKYGKIIKEHINYLTHSTLEDVKVGDKVVIKESKPISKLKRWEILNVVKD